MTQQVVSMDDILTHVASFLQPYQVREFECVSTSWYRTLSAYLDSLVFPFLILRSEDLTKSGYFEYRSGTVVVTSVSQSALPVTIGYGKSSYETVEPTDFKGQLDIVVPSILPILMGNHQTQKTPLLTILDAPVSEDGISLYFKETHNLEVSIRVMPLVYQTVEEDEKNKWNPSYLTEYLRRYTNQYVVPKGPDALRVDIQTALLKVPRTPPFVPPVTDPKPINPIQESRMQYDDICALLQVVMFSGGEAVPEAHVLTQLRHLRKADREDIVHPYYQVGTTSHGTPVMCPAREIATYFETFEEGKTSTLLYVADNSHEYTDTLNPHPMLCRWTEETFSFDKTAAWSTLTPSARKIWTAKYAMWVLWGTAGTYSSEHEEPDSSMVWVHVFSGSKQWYVHQDGAWCTFVQKAGDLVVMPRHVRHVVLNLERTLAIAKNFDPKIK